MDQARERTLALVAPFSDEELEAQLSPIMSPLVWDLAHIAAYEDLWLAHRHGGEELLRADLAARLRRLRDPARGARRGRAARGRCRRASTWRRSARAPWMCSNGAAPATACSARWCCATSSSTPRRCARRWRSRACSPTASRSRLLGGEDGWIAFPAGSFAMGAREDGFAYDNERPRHDVARRPPSAIARRPVTQRELDARSARAAATNAASGGRTRAGRGRRSTTSPTIQPWQRVIRRRPSATSAGSRPTPSPARTMRACPTEQEWERAATSEQRRGRRIGAVWEWTASSFLPLPRVRGLPLPGVLRGVLRRALPRAARRLLGHLTRASRRRRSATGTCRSAARSSLGCAWPRTEPADGAVPPAVGAARR